MSPAGGGRGLPAAPEPGHLFIVAGDVTRIHCDAWLLPTTRGRDLVRDFADAAARGGVALPERWPDDARVLQPPQGDEGPVIWLGDVGRRSAGPEWFAACAVQFVEQAVATVSPSRTGCPPLLALPALGTRYGGADWHAKGEVLRSLVDSLGDVCARTGADVVLVLWGEDERSATAMYSAAQRARRDVMGATPHRGHWRLGRRQDELEGLADELAARARAGRLVLFLGSGVSAGANLPTWQALIDGLATEIGLDGDELERLRRLDLRDQATIVGGGPGGARR